MYIKRHAEKTVQELSRMFGAVLVAEPRQVGKTTMLEKLTAGMNYATLDDPLIFNQGGKNIAGGPTWKKTKRSTGK